MALVAKPDQTAPATAVAVAVVLGTLLLVRRGWFSTATLVGLVIAGVELRLPWFGHVGSDVLRVTAAAIEQMLRGGNPYAVGDPGTVLASTSFPYGPVALLWYLPLRHEARLMEMAAALAVLLLLALARRPVGLAIYAAAPILVLLSTDGSNDTSAGLLILLALAIAERRPRTGAAILAMAAGFKLYAAAWLVPLLAWAGLPLLIPFLAVSAVVWSPLMAWGPGSLLSALQRAEAVHAVPYFSLAEGAQRLLGRPLAREIFLVLQLVLGLGTVVLASSRVRSHDGMVLAGTAILLVTMFTGYWATPAYLAAIAPILCWKVDRWLAIRGDARVPDAAGPRLVAPS